MDKKEAYQEKLHAQLDEWSAKIDVLKAKAAKAEAATKADYQETIEDLQEKRQAAKDKLEELGAAGDDAWQDMKEGIEAAWSSLGAAIKSASSRFK
jgi:chromosome segregation ATPase